MEPTFGKISSLFYIICLEKFEGHANEFKNHDCHIHQPFDRKIKSITVFPVILFEASAWGVAKDSGDETVWADFALIA